jgi:hypothetical protein
MLEYWNDGAGDQGRTPSYDSGEARRDSGQTIFVGVEIRDRVESVLTIVDQGRRDSVLTFLGVFQKTAAPTDGSWPGSAGLFCSEAG